MILKIVGPFAFAYFLSYLFRVVNAVAGPELVAEFGIDAGSLGLLTSIYFLTFAAAQLPLGIALDRYGPRLVESILLVVAAAGALAFALSDGMWTLIIGRGLIGLGVSAALMGAFKAFAMVLPLHRLPAFNGVQLAGGALGVLAGGAPANWIMEGYGWRGLFVGLSILSLVAAALVAAFGPRWQGGHESESFGQQMRAVGSILGDPIFVRIALFVVPSQATSMAVQGLWAGPWLRDVAGLDPAVAAAVLSAMAIAMMAGYLAFGPVASRLAARGVATIHVAVSGMVVYLALQALLVFAPPAYGIPIWCAYAFFATAGVLVYPALTGLFAPHLAGRVNTAVNFLTFVASFVFQWLIGVVVARLAPSQGFEATFDTIFLGLLALQLTGFFILLPKLRHAGVPRP